MKDELPKLVGILISAQAGIRETEPAGMGYPKNTEPSSAVFHFPTIVLSDGWVPVSRDRMLFGTFA